jgi:hypothetical protein
MRALTGWKEGHVRAWIEIDCVKATHPPETKEGGTCMDMWGPSRTGERKGGERVFWQAGKCRGMAGSGSA